MEVEEEEDPSRRCTLTRDFSMLTESILEEQGWDNGNDIVTSLKV